MKCPNCKQEIEDNSVFCEWCGSKIEKRAASTQEKPYDSHPKTIYPNKKSQKSVWLLIGGILTLVCGLFFLLRAVAYSTYIGYLPFTPSLLALLLISAGILLIVFRSRYSKNEKIDSKP